MGKSTYIKMPVDEDTQSKVDDIKRKDNLRKEISKAIFAWILFGILLCVGIGFLIYSAVREDFRHSHWVATSAEVVDIETNTKVDIDHKIKYYYNAVFNYVYDGIEYSVADKTGGSTASYKIGDTTTIYVNPNNPKEFESQATTKFFYIFGAIATMLSFCALCFISYPVLDAAYPKSDWPDYVGHYLPVFVFMWTVTIVSCIEINSKSVLNIGALIVFLVALAFSIFMTSVMIKSIVENVNRRRRIAKITAQIEDREREYEEFKKAHSELFEKYSHDKDDK